MTIKIISIQTAQFTDVNGIGRFLYGCPLSDRTLLSESLQQVQQFIEAHPEASIQDLLLDNDFYDWVKLTANLCGLKLDWLVNDDHDLVYELMIFYEKDNLIYRGDIESLEFGYRYTRPDQAPPKPPLDLPTQKQYFDELWFYGCNGQLHKLKDLDVYNYERFKDLATLLIQITGERSLDEAWDTEPLAQEIITEAIGLFGLTPKDISVAMASKLLISEDWLPGWLHQLLADKPSKDGKPLPSEETLSSAAIAGAMSENYPMNIAVESIRGIPQKQLSRIIKSRNRMIKEAMGKKGGLTEEQADKHRKNIESTFGMLANPEALKKAAANGKKSI